MMHRMLLSLLCLLCSIALARPAAGATVTAPPVNATFDYQIGGAYPPRAGVGIVDRDWHESAATGIYSICYINAFQTQPEEASFWKNSHNDLLLHRDGTLITDPDWPGEYILDTGTAAKRSAIAAIESSWLTGCKDRGFQAVESDNLDTFDRFTTLLTRPGNLALAKLLADQAHVRGLALAQKNTAELTASERTQVGFDFAIAEECQRYNECGSYTAVYGSKVIEIEYTDYTVSFYTAACAAQGRQISVIRRDRDVVTPSDSGYRYTAC